MAWLLQKHKDLESDPGLLSSQSKLMVSQSSVKDCLKKQGNRMEEDTWHWPLASACTQVHVHPYTCTRTENQSHYASEYITVSPTKLQLMTAIIEFALIQNLIKKKQPINLRGPVAKQESKQE